MRLSDLAASAALVNRSTRDRGLYPGRDLTDHDLHLWWIAFQNRAASIGIPLRVVWGFRSWDEQQLMVDRRVTRAKPGQSSHNFGLALDIIHSSRAWDGMPKAGWELLGLLGKEVARQQGLALDWGGDWDRDKRGGLGWDAAHWQRSNWRKTIPKPCGAECLPMFKFSCPRVPPNYPVGDHLPHVKEVLKGLP